MKIGDKVEVIADNDGGGGDEWAIGLQGVIKDIDDDGYYAEVSIDGDATYQFGLYQLVAVA